MERRCTFFLSTMSSPLLTPSGSCIDLPLLSGAARETNDTNTPPTTPTRSWRRFSFLSSSGLPLTPPPRYIGRTPLKSNGPRRLSYQDFALGVCTIPCCFITLLYAYGATLGSPKLQGLYKNT